MGARLDGQRIVWTREVEVGPIARELRDVVAKHTGGTVRLFTPDNEEERGYVKYLIELGDDRDLTVKVWMEDVLRAPRQYTDQLLADIDGAIEQAQASRQQAERIRLH